MRSKKNHGFSNTPTYRSWKAMNSRCKNKNTKDASLYSSRGVSVCVRWNSFENFLLDMGERPDGMTLDRIDNNLGYFKDNCRWASPLTQSLNRRTAAMVKINGQSKNLSVWLREYGVKAGTYKLRKKLGWSTVDAIIKPVRVLKK